MLTLADNPQEKLTGGLWEKWKNAGYTEAPNALTWMEVNNLAGFYLKTCRSAGADYRDFDFETLIDHTLNYYENTSLIVNAVGEPKEQTEQDALAELNNHLQEDYGLTIDKKLKPTTELEAEIKQLRSELKRVSADYSQLTEKLNQPPPQPQQVIIKETPIIQQVSNSDQYTQAELVEIMEYLIKRKKQKHAGHKLTANTSKILRGCYRFAYKVFI